MKILSPLYEVLVYLEERGKLSLGDIGNYPRASARGIIGKLEAMGFIRKEGEGSLVTYSLSENGYKFLNSILDILHKEIVHWDGKWRFVYFSIPEKRRPARDKFRRFLESLGMRPVLGNLWVSPLDIRSQVVDSAEKLDIQSKYIFFETSTPLGQSNESILKSWDLSQIRGLYERYIENSENLLSSKDRNDTIKIKKLILEYALILNNEPNLPIELLPRDWPKYRANLQYKKLRRQIAL